VPDAEIATFYSFLIDAFIVLLHDNILKWQKQVQLYVRFADETKKK
jgi:hypothetical protein